ncbi:sialoadhesin-like [Sardina pilchardus]|uniref:sialoadhesin-like n=1 Tax=Sardina pilchardus TaxID=27697 RepID=UPI002E11EC20
MNTIQILSELQVLVSPAAVKEGDNVTLTCSTTCSLSTNPSYIWYRNSQPLSNSNTTSSNTLSVASVSRVEDADFYSCAVRGHEDHPSPSVCVPSGWSVTYTPQSICALKGSSVELHSYYTYPCDHTVTKAFWFTTLVDGTGKEDLSGDERYQDRVNYTENNKNSHTLSIRHLNLGDAKSYTFRFITDKGGKYSGENVEVTVTELQVQVSPATVKEGDAVTLTCSTTCSLSTNPTYIWYRNSQPLSYTANNNTLSITSFSKEDAGYYSCAVRGHEDHPSPSVCVLSCWSVTYTSQSICALKGSSVELHSYYTYPQDHTVTKAFWFTTLVDGTGKEDLSRDEHYQGRLDYTENSKNSHTLTIRNLNLDDAKSYTFRFITDQTGGKYSGATVELTVTELQALVSPATVKEGDNVTLTCSTTCSLSTNPSYIWYRNSQPLSNSHTANNTLAIDSISPEDAGKYSCAVMGHEIHKSPEVILDVRYAPKQTSASVSPSGDIVEGSSVTLTCSSDANPPVHTYTWYKMLEDHSSQVGSNQNHNLVNISSEQSGLYYCVAENEIGKHNSSAVHINVTYAPRNTSVSVSPSGDIEEGSSVTLTCSSDANPPVHTYTWYRRKNGSESSWIGQEQSYSITNISTEHSGLRKNRSESTRIGEGHTYNITNISSERSGLRKNRAYVQHHQYQQ